MTKQEFIDNLLREVSYRSIEGYPNLNNPAHVSLLSEILTEWGMSDIKTELIYNLTEAEKDDEFTHTGGGTFVKVGQEDKEDAQKYTKDEMGKYSPISDTEAEKRKNKAGELGGKNNNPNAKSKSKPDSAKLVEPGSEVEAEPETGTSLQDPQSQARFKKEAEAATADRPTEKKKSEPEIDKEDKKILNRVKDQINKNSVTFTENQKAITNSCYELTEKLFDNDISDAEKITIAQKIKETYKISTNAGATKYYINVLGGNRKIFGDGTQSTKHLVAQLKKYTQLDEVDISDIKKNLTAAAKPDLGKEFEIKPKDNGDVKQLFQSSPVLSRIRESVHGIFAPKDNAGNVLFPSNKHPREYLKQSFNNPALKKTIELAQEYSDKGILSQDYVDALIKHQAQLNRIIDTYDIPSEETAIAVVDSYNDLMVGLNNTDSEAAAAVMKQLAENRLYEEALARGEEVYLPSNGTFPAGDMIRVGGDSGEVETVSLVSCKFGKVGRIYGCPANMKAITQLHPDETKRDLFGQYVGEKGFTMMIKDELIAGETKEETTKKTKDLLKKSFLSQNLSELFTDEELTEVSEISSEYYYKLNQLRTKLEGELGNVSTGVFWGEFQKELGKFKKDFAVRIQKIVTAEKLEKLVGINNVPNFKTRLTPDTFLSATLLCDNIRTSGGYGLSHNKQYYDENGTPVSKTDKGTADPNGYSITIRNERTPGRNGGGLLVSFSGDGERPVGELLPNE